MSEPLNLYVGVSAQNEDLESQMVLEFSARKHCSVPLNIHWMRQGAGIWSGWKSSEQGRTPFSSFRWGIPAASGFVGRAAYCDADFVVMADLADLFNQPIPHVLLARKSNKPHGKIKTCCTLFDCEKAKAHIAGLDVLRGMPDPQGHYSNYFKDHDDLVDRWEGDWNAIDLGGYDSPFDPRVKAIHYSRIETQPVLKYAIPRLKAEGKAHWYTGEVRTHDRQDLIDLFDSLYHEALASGYTLEQYRVKPYAGQKKRNFTYSHHKGVPVA